MFSNSVTVDYQDMVLDKSTGSKSRSQACTGFALLLYIMSSRSYYIRTDMSRDTFSKSRRHLGAADREWRSGKITSRRVIEKPRSSSSIKRYLIGAAFFLIVIIVIAVIVVVRNRGSDIPPEEPITCAPGFSGEKCDSTSFIGSQSWSDTLPHRLSDGKYYSYGIAFRIFAPSATTVQILVSNNGEMEKSHEMM